MFQVNADWNPLQSRLKEIILKKDYYQEARELLLQLHSIVHSSEVYDNHKVTFMDEVWEGLSDTAFRRMPTVKDDTVAWSLWHITRIEDLTSNYLVAGQNQVLNEEWLSKLNIVVTDTGNAMTDQEIIEFSNKIDKDSLYQYRKMVGSNTRKLLMDLKPEDMKRKVPEGGLQRIADTGGVTSHPDSVWLLDFWGRKNIAGILQMPITRHQIVHLSDCRRIKNACEKLEHL